jgi:hypothetical protein
MTEVQGGLRGKENWDRSSGNKNLFAREHQQTLRVIEDSQYTIIFSPIFKTQRSGKGLKNEREDYDLFHRKPYQILSPISRRLDNKIPLQSYAR